MNTRNTRYTLHTPAQVTDKLVAAVRYGTARDYNDPNVILRLKGRTIGNRIQFDVLTKVCLGVISLSASVERRERERKKKACRLQLACVLLEHPAGI